MSQDAPFRFVLPLVLTEMLGRSACSLEMLREGLLAVPDSSLYYHTHHLLHQHVNLSPEPPNDFAFWLTNAMGLERIGEALASINIVKIRNLSELRARYVAVLDAHRNNGLFQSLRCPEGWEFHFLSGRMFLLPTGYEARTLDEFARVLERVPLASILHHVFAPRLRMNKPQNDLAAWAEALGRAGLAADLNRLDPYPMTLEGLRRRIIERVNAHARA